MYLLLWEKRGAGKYGDGQCMGTAIECQQVKTRVNLAGTEMAKPFLS